MNIKDRLKYEELQKKKKEEMTEEEWKFFIRMYHLEEFEVGML